MKKKRANAKSKLTNYISELVSGVFRKPEGLAYARVRLPVSQPRLRRQAQRKR